MVFKGTKYAKPVRVLVDSFADTGLLNAQMGNAREIVSRMDPDRFQVRMFVLGEPDIRIASRPNTQLIRLPQKRQTLRILSEFLWGSHEILFYMKSSPASRWYLNIRNRIKDSRPTIGTLESQSDLKNEPTIAPEAVRLWEQTILRCDYLFSNSKSVQRSAEREYELASEIIPTGVDTRFFVPKRDRPQNSRPQVLFVGSLRPFKQPQLVVEAALHFAHVDFRLAGEGVLTAELRTQIATLGLKNVILLGTRSAEELRWEYQNADIFLFPSKWEGSPKVILEAAACGLPVIVRNDYSPETVLHGVTGYQAESNQQVLRYLECLLNNAVLRREMGVNGRKLSQKYDWDLITERWEETLLSLARPQLARNVS